MSQEKILRVLGDPQPRKPFPKIKEYLREQERLARLKGKPSEPPKDVQEETQEQQTKVINPAQFSKEDFILLEGRTHGTYSYPDLLISMYRLGMSPEVEQAAQQLGYSLTNTAKEQNRRGYIGGIHPEQALKLNLTLGRFTPNIRQFVDFLQLLNSGKAFDGTGKRISESKLTEILNEITTGKYPFNCELLDTKFEDKDGILYINYNHKLDSSGNLIYDSEQLEECLMTDYWYPNISLLTFPIIDFNYWLNNATKQGLPLKNNPITRYMESSSFSKSLVYQKPNEGHFAYFSCYSFSSYPLLDCGSLVARSDQLGVRSICPTSDLEK